MKAIASLSFIFAWVFGYSAQIRFPLIAMDVAAVLLLLANRRILLNRHCERRDVRRPRSPSDGRAWQSDRRLVLNAALGVFTLSWILSLRMLSLADALPGLFYLLRVSMYFVILLFASDFFATVKHWIPFALWIFIALGFAQYVLLPDTRFLLHSGWDEHYYRMIGTVLDPNYMGAMLGIIGIFGVFEFTKRKEKRWLLLGAASLVALVLTFSRASWLATLLGGSVLAFHARKDGPYKDRPFPANTMLAVTVLLLIVLFLAPKPGGEGVRLTRTTSVSERLASWQDAISIWQRHPLFGVGFNNYRAAGIRYGLLADPSSHAASAPSSGWLLLLSTLGIVGVLALLVVLKVLIMQVAADPLWSAIAVLVGVHAMFNNTFFFVPVLALLGLVVASRDATTESSGS